ncbi:FAD:protein FMN transferase [Saprospiraceae bacterium]|jgi:thiamine biosynthesis lipoprotein|nr:FAD:protein FMN transferase [Saprospiraceae bacterium]MDB4505546.1 FAD:protein FMN transferase [Saprospiraceae bacterium]MDC3219632.1 FAD:protein FMN transferase [Saprospiraceae bacterium]MDG1435427.1 FAD:protein FMN transferase [Saprospiraceae bacterium]
MKRLLILACLVLLFSCQNEFQGSASKFLKIKGETMGTTYHITYEDELGRNFKNEIDIILLKLNQSVSTYIPDSEISKFNQNKEINTFDRYFRDVTLASQKIFEETDGLFDPTVMPLVNYWGFGYTEKKAITDIDSFRVDSLKKLVGFEKIKINCDKTNLGLICSFSKNNPNIQLDYSAIAKGYGVDIVANFFQEKKIKNFLVEIGGELRTSGKNSKKKIWTTAINTPKINAQLNEYEAIIKVFNKGIATSGNYRNFYEANGEWYGHEINPKTGFPEKSNLLSVTIMADDCMSADAYATAMMVMGLEKSKALAAKVENIDAFFIFANEIGKLETFYTKGFEGIILE